MAYHGWDEISAVTYNDTDLKAFCVGIDGLEDEAIMEDFHPPGSVYPTPIATGTSKHGVVTITWLLDGGAAGPAVKCAKGTSSTLTATIATGLSVTGMFIVSKTRIEMGADQNHHLVTELTPSGTITYDLAE